MAGRDRRSPARLELARVGDCRARDLVAARSSSGKLLICIRWQMGSIAAITDQSHPLRSPLRLYFRRLLGSASRIQIAIACISYSTAPETGGWSFLGLSQPAPDWPRPTGVIWRISVLSAKQAEIRSKNLIATIAAILPVGVRSEVLRQPF
jgi:hypothetical protein